MPRGNHRDRKRRAAVTMRKKTLRDLQPADKRVFVRVDFNVPLKNGEVTDDRRIRGAVPTLNLLLNAGARVICASHLGRPGGRRVTAMTLRPVATVLSRCLGRPVTFVQECIGPEAERAATALPGGGVLLLENVRFEAGEQQDDPALAERFAALADAYVNDAFGTAHRAHASTSALAARLHPAVAGLLMETEIASLSRLVDDPARPYVAVLGGAKMAGKIDLIDGLLTRADTLLVGGAMAYTFLAAQGVEVGRSLVDTEHLDLASKLVKKARRCGVTLKLPIDHVVATSLESSVTELTESADIPADRLGGDIGPRTVECFAREIAAAGTILWNGPLGAFEAPPFAGATRAVAEAIRSSPAFTVVGGGDSAAALRLFGMEAGFDHISTGGGAALQLLAGHPLPGLEALDDAEV